MNDLPATAPIERYRVVHQTDYSYQSMVTLSQQYLHLTPRPDLLLPAYYHGRNLAESYYLAIPGLSWMNIVVGDPLCSLGKPSR